MRSVTRVTLLVCCLTAAIGFTQTTAPPQTKTPGDSLPQKFVSFLDLSAAGDEAEARLLHAPSDVTALFVRMETAELQERPEFVLDSALRLCTSPADPALQELASSRVLQHAANTRVFNSVLRRVKSAALASNACTFNLRLALVAAATDGLPKIDLDQAVRAAGLITHWRIAGPFGHYNNVDFERRWPPETDGLARQRYASEPTQASAPDPHKKRVAASDDATYEIVAERFWFRDGMLALPEYLFGLGTFYAAGDVEIPTAQSTRIEVLSSGSYVVFVDGKQALLHDVRYSAGPSRDSGSLRLGPGHHRIVVKFTIDAAPLSVALHPQSQRGNRKAELPQPLEKYTQAVLAHFHGDFVGMERMLDAESERNAAAMQYLRAMLYSSAEEHSPRADAAWQAVATAQPSAFLARLKAAESAVLHGQSDDTRLDVMRILAERPQSETALQLAFTLSRSRTEAPGLMGRLLELHPSCARLAQAVKFYSSTAEQDKARQIEQQLSTCAPESLQYARTLAESGRNSAAAAYLQQVIVRNPLHRTARRLLVEQLLLSNQLGAARLQAKQLRELAPNARNYARLAEDPGTLQDSKSPRAQGFTEEDEFYVMYRRDGPALVRKSAQRTFSGGPAVVLLSDKVIEVGDDGSVSVYTHRLTRPLNKDGISHYGEVTLPRGAELLELRTIKASGQIIEPELAQQKPTISMPALEPGDAIEEEYVSHYSVLEQAPDGATALTFGSFAAPILYSRLVLLSPRNAEVNVREQAGPPQPLVGGNKETVVRIWERDNIAQTVPESFLPSTNLLPTVTVAAPEKTRDRLRDDLIEATRTGVHAHETALSLHLEQSSETEKAKRLYRFVTTKIDSTGPEWAGSPAEDTLQNGQGSRTAALLALARTSGIKAGLLLARKVDQRCGKELALSCYTEPLVRFWLGKGDAVDVDAESDDLPFGAVPPSLDTRDALFIPLLEEEVKKPEIVALTARLVNEKSVAEGDLSFHEGDLVANIQVQLGPVRAQEVRSTLRNAGERERQAFFEQLALRIFPGATAVSGTAENENDPEEPLKLSLRCTAQQFINRQSGTIEISQLAPALGLATLYAKTPARKFPLYIESLYFESTIFHLHLPAGMDVRSLPADFAEKSAFGEYALRFVRSPRQVDIHRDFRIPVQVVAPEKYGAFVHFAVQIDEAEQQRISLGVVKDVAGGPPKNSLQPIALKKIKAGN